MFKNKKLWIIIFLILIGAGFFYLRVRTRRNVRDIDLKEEMLTTVSPQILEEKISIRGNLTPVKEESISFQLSGEVEEILVEEGKKVNKGQKLFILNDDQQQLNYLQADREYQNALSGGSKRDIEEAELRYKIAEKELEKTVIKAPFTGMILEISVEKNENIKSGQELAVLISQVYEIKSDVDETEIHQLEIGQQGKIELDSYPKKLINGNLSDIGSRATSSGGGVVTIPITISLNENHDFFKPGFSADVEIITARIEDALVVPLSALNLKNGQETVFKVVKDEIEPASVTTGVIADYYVQIREGLQEGDRVLINAEVFSDIISERTGGFIGPGRRPAR